MEEANKIGLPPEGFVFEDVAGLPPQGFTFEDETPQIAPQQPQATPAPIPSQEAPIAPQAPIYGQPEGVPAVTGKDVRRVYQKDPETVQAQMPSKASWLDVFESMGRSLAPAVGQAVGGLQQEYGETPYEPLTGMGMGAGRISMTPEEIQAEDIRIKEHKQRQAERGEALYAGATERMTEIQPDVTPGSVKQYVGQAGQSVVQMVPALGLGIVTGSPIVPLAVIGGQVKGQTYGEQRAGGSSPEVARMASTGAALAEAIPEALPMSILLKPGGTALRRILSTIAAEEMQELVTESLQAMIDKGTITPEMTWGDAKARLKNVAIVTPLSAGTLAGTTHMFMRGKPTTEQVQSYKDEISAIPEEYITHVEKQKALTELEDAIAGGEREAVEFQPEVDEGSPPAGFSFVDEVEAEPAPAIKAYHGTKATDIRDFKQELAGTASGDPNAVLGSFFTTSKREAGVYGKNIIPVELNFKKTYKDASMDEIVGLEEEDYRAMRKELIGKGYDSIAVEDEESGETWYVALYPEQIKLLERAGEVEAEIKAPVTKPAVQEPIKKDVPRGTLPEIEEVTPEGKRIISDEIYEAAQKRLKEKYKGLKTGIDPTTIPDLIIVGAHHIETGIRSFSIWSKKMVGDYGERIKPHLRDIWKKSNMYLTPEVPTKKVKGQVRRTVGIEKMPKMVREDVALAAAWKKAEQSARKAFRAGNKEGVAAEYARMGEIIDKAKARVKETAGINKLKYAVLNEIKTTRVKKQTGKPIGKFTADVQKVLDKFREATRMSPEQARERIASNLERYSDKEIPDGVGMENRILDIVARLREEKGLMRKRFTPAELTSLLEEVRALKNEGKMLTELRKFNRQSKDMVMVDDVVDVVMGGKDLPQGLETTGTEQRTPSPKEFKAWLGNFTNSLGVSFVGWNDLLDMLSARDKTSAPGKSILSKLAEVHTTENAEKKGRKKATQWMADTVKEVWGFKNDGEMLTQFNLDAQEMKIGHFVNAKGIKVELKMTKAEARKFIMEYSDPDLHDTFYEGMSYTDEMIKAVEKTLTTKDKAFIAKQMEFYREYHGRVNSIYRDKYGVDLPFNEFYSPIRREGFDAPEGLFGEFLDEVSYRRSVSSGSLKSRVKNIRRLARRSDIFVFERHIAEMEHFIAWSEKVRDLNAIFKNTKVRTAIKLHHKPSMLFVIDKFINDFTRGGVETADRLNSLDKFRGRFTRSVLALKPSIAIKQLTSTVAYMEVMPITDFTIGVAEFWSNPIKAVRFLKKHSVWFAERGTYMERDIKTALKMNEYAAFRKKRGFVDLMMLNVQLGDQGAIAMGGYAYYKYLTKKKGMSHKEAILEFERFSEMTQQSADLSIQSNIQRMGSFAKLFSMFLSSPNLYMRKELGAVRNLLAGRGSTAGHIKTLAIYHLLLPMLFQLVSDGFEWETEKQKRAVIMGPLNGIFIVGEGIEHLVSKALGLRTWSKEIAIYSAVDDLGKFISEAIKMISEGELTYEEVYRAIRGLAGSIGAVTGLPLKYAVDQTQTVRDFIDGDYEKALKEVLAFSPYMLEQQKKKPKFTIWGEPLEGEFRQMFTLKKEDALDKEIDRLDIKISQPGRKIDGVKLTDDEYSEYAVLAGKEAKKRLDKFIASQGYTKKSDGLKIEFIKKAVSMSRGKARAKMKRKYPHIPKEAWERRRKKRKEILTGATP